MVIKERIDKANIHIYIQKLQARGFRKVGKQVGKNFNAIIFARGSERLTLKYTDNGWLSIY